MIALPKKGDKVKVWPFPGRLVQASKAPIDRFGGGRALSPDGEVIAWDGFHLTQLKQGDILLHAPPVPKEAPAVEEPKLFDPEAEAAREMKRREDLEARRVATLKKGGPPELRKGRGKIMLPPTPEEIAAKAAADAAADAAAAAQGKPADASKK